MITGTGNAPVRLVLLLTQVVFQSSIFLFLYFDNLAFQNDLRLGWFFASRRTTTFSFHLPIPNSHPATCIIQCRNYITAPALPFYILVQTFHFQFRRFSFFFRKRKNNSCFYKRTQSILTKFCKRTYSLVITRASVALELLSSTPRGSKYCRIYRLCAFSGR